MKQILLTPILSFSMLVLSAQSPTDSTGKVQFDSADLYGFIPEKPIKVGGGPAKQREYLESLRDAQGKKISYERKGSCCAYSSPNGLGGYALLDKYEIAYRDGSDEKQKKIIYISFYDYEKPRAFKGFTLAD